MSVTWKISVGASLCSLADWGIDTAFHHERNFDVGELQLSVPLRATDDAPIFAYGDTLTLWRDSTRWFIGTVTALPVSLQQGQLRQTFTVSNAWWTIARIVYQQSLVVYATPSCSGVAGLYGSMSTRVVLGQDAWGRKITTDQQITNIAFWALFHGGALYTLSALATPFTTPPLMELRDIDCAEAIKRMVAFTPDCVGSFDYSPGVPVLSIRRYSALSAVSLDLADANLVEVVGELTPRHDLVPPGVVLTFVSATTPSLDSGGDGSSYATETRQSYGATSGPGVIFASIELALQGTDQAEAVPASLAQDLYLARQTLHYAGEIRLHERDCSGSVRVGQRVNLLGSRAEHATMAAVVQSVSEDLFSGVTSLKLGPPEHLAPQDFVTQMLAFRNRPAPSTFAGTQHNGTAGVTLDTDCNPPPATPPGFPDGVTGPVGVAPGVGGSGTPNANAGRPAKRDSAPGASGGMEQSVSVEVCVDGVAQTLSLRGGFTA